MVRLQTSSPAWQAHHPVTATPSPTSTIDLNAPVHIDPALLVEAPGTVQHEFALFRSFIDSRSGHPCTVLMSNPMRCSYDHAVRFGACCVFVQKISFGLWLTVLCS
jgi:hypothetical protein